MQIRSKKLTAENDADFRNWRAALTGAYLKYVTEGLQAHIAERCVTLSLVQSENLCRFGQQVSDSDGSVLVARNRGDDLHVVRRCANFSVIDSGEWCISA